MTLSTTRRSTSTCLASTPLSPKFTSASNVVEEGMLVSVIGHLFSGKVQNTDKRLENLQHFFGNKDQNHKLRLGNNQGCAGAPTRNRISRNGEPGDWFSGVMTEF